MPTSLGVYDGRIVELDPFDSLSPAAAAFPAVLPRAPLGGRGGIRARPGLLSTLNGISGTHANHDHRQGFGALGGMGMPMGPANIGMDAAGIEQCPGTFCPIINLIPRRCQYTPVLRSASGYYCAGCAIDICPEPTGRQARRRERRIRQRLCRRMGICLDRPQRPVRPGGDVV